METIPDYHRTIKSFLEAAMQFIGIDLHTNKFTCCYRDDSVSPEGNGEKQTETFELTAFGLAQFYRTLTPQTYVLVESTITSFSFARLVQPLVKEILVANTYELKQISLGRKKTDKVDADKLCRIVKMQVLSGEKTISSVTIPPVEIQELRGLFSTYRLLKKQTTQTKNRIHSVLKERLYGFTLEQIFGKKSRKMIRELESDTVMSRQLHILFHSLEGLEADIQLLEDLIMEKAEPFMKEIQILTSMKGVSVFIAIAIIADIITVDRFKDSKSFTSYLRSAPKVTSSNTSMSIRGTNKKGRKLSATLLSQSLNHVLDASPKLNRWYTRLTRYKKAGLVRTGLRRRVFAEIYQMLKKGEYHYGREVAKHEIKLQQYTKFLEKRRENRISA
jgi:transposase